MRIAIDARMMGAGKTRGIGRYIEELIRAMIKLETAHTFVLLEQDPDQSPFRGASSVEHVRANFPWYGLAEQRRLPKVIREARADLVHFPHWNVPFWFEGKSILTVHDLLLRSQPMSAKASTRSPLLAWSKRVGYRTLLRRSMDRAGKVLVPTEAVKAEIHRFYPLLDYKVVVTGEGITDLPAPDFIRVPKTPYYFYVGSAYPHKRLDLLLESWLALASKTGDRQLVIAGEEDVFMKRLHALVEKRHIPRVLFLGRVTDPELSGLYQKADLFVFPSSHEGFGLPPLEALVAGCPVLASSIPALQEVLPREGVLFFRAGDKNDMMQTLDTALNQLSILKVGAHKGAQEVLARWTWRRTAEITIQAYERVLQA